ncbi:hypothetical protein FA15DRAFT_667364 [Coprinopsis marcescibilis]|uniref:Uncharacterized protein n=1 Tax=Coprinopsis marcescibilis TaxID=230819 RepID=A0A5C3L0J0_COPMA|nr:hypothetical protein FA15DRAFT_667364 [Coprinopsis marcescibilis]
MTTHLVGYSKSIRAKCHGPLPCKNSAIPIGTLRYGRATRSELGEQVEWRHWGCVTPEILYELARVTANKIVDFDKLLPADQQKIRLAVTLRRVAPEDIPATAKVAPRVTIAPTPVAGQKRKAADMSMARTQEVVPRGTALSLDAEDCEEEEDIPDELYCVLKTSVVGIQYYKGMVGPGEQVLIVREPHNQYDRNAIQVKNMRNVQVGHLPRNVVSKLAPLLDRGAVTVEGTINDGNLGGGKPYTLSISIKLYGGSDKRPQLEPQLVWATPGQKGFPKSATRQSQALTAAPPTYTPNIIGGRVQSSAGPSYSQVVGGMGTHGSSQQRAAAAAQQEASRKKLEAIRKAGELRQMLESLDKVDDDGRRNSLLDTVCSKDDILNLPVHPSPPGTQSGDLRVDLLKHQSQALQWCIDRENPRLPKEVDDPPVQFWKLEKSKNSNKNYYFNIATKTPQEEVPQLGKGALCADAMGLGKTLTMLALILATKSDNPSNFSKSTLIVAPLSIISNWEKQIADHVTPGALRLYIYYGTGRKITAQDLKKYDIVITTYETVKGEHEDGPASSTKKRKFEQVLFDIPWKRIILDEGHVIRNPKTKMSKAVVGLHADRRWVLTGTPIINTPRDLGSLLTFLKICQPLDNEDYFKRLLVRPLKNGEAEGAELLKALMNHVCIRRTKEMQDANGVPLIALPPVEMIKVPVALDDEARRLYDEVEQASMRRVEDMMQTANTAFMQSNVLSMLTRLRQIALHPGLVPARYLEELRASMNSDPDPSQSVQTISAEEKIRLQRLLAQAIEDCEECPICFNILDDARITICAHMFCVNCILSVIERDPRCPMDRRPLTAADLFDKPPPTDLTQVPIRDHEDTPTGIRTGSSAKIDQLVQLLRLSPDQDKSIVFSQFTSFLDKIGEELEAEGISYVRFDGQMSAKRRQEAIAKFSIPITKRAPAPTPPVAETSSGRPRRSTRSVSSSSVTMQLDADDSEDDYNPGNDDHVGMDDMDLPLDYAGEPSLNDNANPKVMLISLKAGALGLNLTVANNVYLMDPWWQEGIESQAIDRVNRIGQTKPVHVYQLIAENTMESKVLEIQERKKSIVKQAFSGITSRETQRQQREARLQDLIELFGARRQKERENDSASGTL